MEWRSPLTNSMYCVHNDDDEFPMILYMNSPSNSLWFSESSPARLRNSPWFSLKFPCYGFKIPPGVTHPFGFTQAPRWAPDVGDFWRLRVKWHKTTRHTYKRQTHSGQRKNNNCASKQAHGLFLCSPPWAEFQTVWPNLFSTPHVRKCYCTAKQSEIPA